MIRRNVNPRSTKCQSTNLVTAERAVISVEGMLSRAISERIHHRGRPLGRGPGSPGAIPRDDTCQFFQNSSTDKRLHFAPHGCRDRPDRSAYPRNRRRRAYGFGCTGAHPKRRRCSQCLATTAVERQGDGRPQASGALHRRSSIASPDGSRAREEDGRQRGRGCCGQTSPHPQVAYREKAMTRSGLVERVAKKGQDHCATG